MIHPDFQASFYKWASSKLLFSTCSLLSLDLTLTPRKWNAFTRDLEIWRCWHQNPMYKGRAVENHQNQYQPKHKNWDRFVFLVSLELCTLTGSSIFWAKKGLHIKWKHILNTAPPVLCWPHFSYIILLYQCRNSSNGMPFRSWTLLDASFGHSISLSWNSVTLKMRK